MFPITLSNKGINRPFLREPAKTGKGKMRDSYETYIDGSYIGRVNLWQNSKYLGGLWRSVEHFKDLEA